MQDLLKTRIRYLKVSNSVLNTKNVAHNDNVKTYEGLMKNDKLITIDQC